MADGIFSRPPAPRPSVELTPSTPSLQVQPDAAAAIAQTNRDSLETAKDDRKTQARLQSNRHDGGSDLADHPAQQGTGGQRAAAALQGEVALLGSEAIFAQPTTVADFGNPATFLLEVASLRVPSTPLELAVATALSAVSLAVTDSVAHAFAPAPQGSTPSLQLYGVDGDGRPLATRLGVEVDQGRLGAAGYPGEGPVWPWLGALGLQDHLLEMMRQAPQAEPWALALIALTGREAMTLTKNAGREALFAALSQSNPPLGLPVLLGLEPGAGGRAVVVTGTGLAQDGSAVVHLLDVEAWLAGAGEGARYTLALDEVLRRLMLAVLPDARHGTARTERHREALSLLGVTGCCLTTSAGAGPERASSRPSAVSRQGGPLSQRCLTCAVAQAACVPTPSSYTG